MENFCKKMALPFSRVAIFLVYFYFGALKVFTEHGAANPMVTSLLGKILPSISPESFLIFFGVFEMLIGLLFIFPKFSRLALFLLMIHLITTVLPLFLMTEEIWRSFLIPTIEGQYIIKNILILALAIFIFANLRNQKRNA